MRRTGRTDRTWLYWLARRLYPRRTAKSPGHERPRSVLVVRVDERVGNLVTLQSLLDALRAGLPDVHLGLLASTRAGQVTSSLQGIDRLHGIDKRWFFRRPGTWKRTLEGVRAQGYQVAIDASAWQEPSTTHAALTWFSGAPVTIGYDRGFDPGLHTVRVVPGPAAEHELAQRMRLLAPLGLGGEPPVLRSSLGTGQTARWAAWLAARPADGPRVGVWPGGRKRERRWPVELYARLGRELADGSKAQLVVLWGPGEERLREALLQRLDDAVAAPPTCIDELAGLLRNLDLIVTNDTGPMHLAVAVGTPTVALFASGDPRRWGHPYPHVHNLALPGHDPAEVQQALEHCRALLPEPVQNSPADPVGGR